MLLMLWGCFAFDPSTRVDELRVMAVQSVPAEITPGAVVDINILMADPIGEGSDVLVWPCTDLGEGCLEAELFADNPSLWIQSFSYEEAVTTLSFSVPMELGGVVSQLPAEFIPFTGTVMWVLACVPGECDVMSQYEQGNLNLSDFSNPSKMIEGIEFGRFALAKRSLRISNRPEPEQIKNPVVEFDENQELVLGIGETKELNFSYEIRSRFAEAVYLSGYSSAGYIQEGPPRGFGEEEFAMEGTLSLQWVAQENPEEGSMYVVLEDDKGGVTFWSAPAAVQ